MTRHRAENTTLRERLPGESREDACDQLQGLERTGPAAQPTSASGNVAANAITGELTADCMIGDRYRLVRLIGGGGMGEVWEAHDQALDRTVAIKVPLQGLDSGRPVLQRFIQESKLLGRTKHPGIVEAFDFGYLPDGRPFAVFEHLIGEPLDSHLSRLGRLSAAEAVFIVDQVCAALAHVHAQGVIHRDLKPSNVFLHCPGRGSTQVKLLDFGIGKSIWGTDASLSLTGCGQVVGTPSYMSYEQARGDGDIDARTDIWNVGILLYEMLTGVRAFERADVFATLASVVSETLPPPQQWGVEVPQKLADVVFRCLRWERDERFQSMMEVRAALADALGRPESIDAARSDSEVDLLETPGQSAISVVPCARTIRGPSTEETFRALGIRSESPWSGSAFVVALVLIVLFGTAYRWATSSSRSANLAVDGPSAAHAQPLQMSAAPRPASQSWEPSPSSSSASPSAPTASSLTDTSLPPKMSQRPNLRPPQKRPGPHKPPGI
ncbi:MAG: serine/threonine protein kinase [Polyangiaceae bacterium]|nr:serine/threonine protein kinase [Polyangiaceae bacterium]